MKKEIDFITYFVFLWINIQNLKVLHIINWLATGGAEKLVVETLPLYNQQEDLKADLALLDATQYPFYKEFKSDASQIKIVELSKGSVYNPMLILKILPLLKQYHIIHVHLFPALYWVAIAKMLSFSEVKLVFTEHSTGNRRLQNPLFRIIDKFIYRAYSKIICISPEVKNQIENLLKIPNDRLVVVNNGINLRKIKSIKAHQREDFGYVAEDCIIVMVAGFRIEKDHETLIASLKYLPANYKLLLVGDGYRRTEIENYIQKLNLSNRITLLGIRSDVYALLKMSDIAVLSSHWEGFGLAAAEAMAAEIPVIASNVDGLAQVVENGGVLFEKGNVKELAEKIKMIAEVEGLQEEYVRIGQKKVLNYDIQKMVDSTVEIYKWR